MHNDIDMLRDECWGEPMPDSYRSEDLRPLPPFCPFARTNSENNFCLKHNCALWIEAEPFHSSCAFALMATMMVPIVAPSRCCFHPERK